MKLWQQNVLIIIILILLVLCAVSISKAGAGSFTIVGATTQAASKIEGTYINNVATNRNYGADPTTYLGKTDAGSNPRRALYNFTTLIDSMRAIGATYQMDSGRLYLVVQTTPTAGDSIFAAIFAMKRAWAVGVGTASNSDTCGVTWDSANATSWGGCSGTPAAWGTAGCDNTTNDRSATRESDSVLITAGVGDKFDTISFGITGATIADTVNVHGLIIIALAYGANDGVGSIVQFFDNSTETGHIEPRGVFYYSDKPTGETTATRRRRALIQQ